MTVNTLGVALDDLIVTETRLGSPRESGEAATAEPWVALIREREGPGEHVWVLSTGVQTCGQVTRTATMILRWEREMRRGDKVES